MRGRHIPPLAGNEADQVGPAGQALQAGVFFAGAACWESRYFRSAELDEACWAPCNRSFPAR